jgi:hypothetical protein
MTNNPYLYEKLVATRQAEIRHDMQLSRKLTTTRQQHTFTSNAANRFGTLLVELGTRLQRTECQREASLS